MKRFSTLLLCCVCVLAPTVLSAQTWVNGQPATWVIGQPDFISNGANNPNITLGLNFADGVAIDVPNNKIYVADRSNHRVLRYAYLPITSNQPTPEVAFGQMDLMGFLPNRGGTVTSQTLNEPLNIIVENSNLWIVDSQNHRVVRYPAAHTATANPTADYVIGQVNFTSNAAATTQDGLSAPHGIAFDAANSKLYISDFGNNRVLRYDFAVLPVVGAMAERVLGQTSYTTAVSGTTPNTFNNPAGLAIGTGGALYVADRTNNRVVRFNAAHMVLMPPPTVNNANVVIGQVNFLGSGTGLLQNRMNLPLGITIDPATQDLYVADRNNFRVLVFSNAASIITGNQPANFVLGQYDFQTNAGITSRAIGQTPSALAFHAGRLIVSQSGNRVLIFNQNLPTLTAVAPPLDANNGTPTQAIVPTFSQAVNLPTATNFRSFGGMTGLRVVGTYAGGTMPSFTPTVPYQRGERIEYTITTGATLGDGVSTNPENKPFLNNITGAPQGRAIPFVGSFRTATTAPAGGVNFVLSTYATINNGAMLGNVTAIAPADYDGDGYIDIAASSNVGANAVIVRRNYGRGNIAQTATMNEGLNVGSTAILDLKAADMSNDGLPDWVYIDAGQVYIHRNTSTPGNLSAIPFATGIGVTGGQKISTGDFDGDGDIDVALIRTAPDELQIYRNNFPTFSLSLHSTTALPGVPSAIATGDFNRDGALDLALGTPNSAFIYINDGGGRFNQGLAPFNPIGAYSHIAVGDLNNDGFTDVAALVQNAGATSVHLALNNAGTAFIAPVSFSLPNGFAATTGGLDFGDIDGNGSLDIIATNPQAAGSASHLTWFRNIGGGAFAPGASNSGSTSLVNPSAHVLALCDIDQDGDLDALAGYNIGAAFPYVAVLRNEQPPVTTALAPTIHAQNVDRSSVLISQTFSSAMTTGTATLVDALSGGSGPIRIFGNMTGGRSRIGAGGMWMGVGTNMPEFTPNNLTGASSANRFHPNELVSVSIPNFQTNAVKNDRFVPVTSAGLTNLGGYVRQFRTNVTGGQAFFVEQQRFTVGTSPRAAATADFNNDGRLDIVVTNEGGTRGYAVFLGGAGGVFTPLAPVGVPALQGNVATGDFNNDGNVDIAIGCSPDVRVFLGMGTGAFGSAISLNTGGLNYSLCVGDFNGDGALDVLASNNGGSVRVFLNNGSAVFTPLAAVPTAGAALSIKCGDIDRDSDLDAILVHPAGNLITILRNDGLGNFSIAQTITLTDPYDVEIGDLSGDAFPDFAVTQYSANQVSIFINNATGPVNFYPTAPSSSLATGTNPSSVVFGNYNGDMFSDLITTNEGSNNISVFTGNGTGVFVPFSNAATGAAPRSWSAAGDFDNDGDIDFVTTNWGANSISILINARPPRINPLVPPGNAASYQRDLVPQRNSHTQVFGAFPLRVRFDQAVTSATASFPNVLPPSPLAVTPGAIRIHGSMTGHRSTPAAQGTWNYLAAANTAEYIPPTGNPFRAGETVMVTVTNAQASTPGGQVFSTSPTVYAFTVAPSGGTGRFVDSRRWDDAAFAGGVVFGDFDNNGRIDMIQSSSNGLNMRLQTGTAPTQFTDPATNIYAGGFIAHCITGDFDSDGAVDIAFIDNAGNIQVRRNISAAFGTTLVSFNPGLVGLIRLAPADFDGDGDLDIATIADAGGVLRVYLNNGNGTAFTQVFNAGLVTAKSILAADVDNDGDMDVVTANNTNVEIWLGQGAVGGLNSLLAAPTPAYQYAIANVTELAAGDFNNDGYLDLVAASDNTADLTVLRNSGIGNGQFTVLGTYATGSSGNAPLVGDFDGDGALDIVSFKSNAIDAKVLHFKGNNAAVFTLTNSSPLVESTNIVAATRLFPAMADLDGDGDLDLGIPLGTGRRTAILFNHEPELKVQATSPLVNASSVALPVAITTIFNQNVTTSTASLPPTGPLRVFGNMTGGRSRAGGGSWSSPAPPINSATFTANPLGSSAIRYYPGEKVEFIASTSTYIQGTPGVANTIPMTTGTVRQFWTKAGTGPATFFQHFQSPIPRPNAASFVQSADFNNDGRIDFVTSEDNTTLRIYLGNGNGTFTAGATVTGAFGTPANGRVVLADMNNDGFTDIINTDAIGSAQIRIFQNSGTGTFPTQMTGSPITASFAGVRGLAVGDADGNGALDLAVTYNATNQVGVFFNPGNGNISGSEQRYTQPGGGGREESALADMDNDGDLDWVITNGSANSVSLRLNSGTGNFDVQAAGSPYPTTITNPTNIQLMDINNDSRIDAVVGGPNANVNIFVNTGMPTIFPAAATLTIPTTSNRPLLGDFDGDARQDITVLQRTPGSFVVGLGNNSGTFPALSAPNQVGTANLNQAIADVDNDGDLDILIAADNTLQIWLNATQPRFVCNSAVDCGPPTFTPNIFPQRNVNTAVAGSLFTWQFTEPMTTASVTATASFPQNPPAPSGAGGSIRVFGNMAASRTPLNSALGSWAFNAAITTATLTSGRALFAGEQIMVSVTQAQSPSGIAVRPYVYSFRARPTSGPAQFYPRSGSLNFLYTAGAGPRSIAFGDFNADNVIDWVAVNQFNNTIVTALGDNTGAFTPLVANSTRATVGTFPVQVLTADVNNDGRLDAVALNSGGGANGIAVFLNTLGTGQLNTPVTYATGANPQSIALGDVDADADLDIVSIENSGGAVIRYNNGSGVFATNSATFPTGTGQGFLRLADVDNDGDLDMVIAQSVGGVTVRLNDGLGNFNGTAVGSPYAGAGAISVDMGDIDNDTDLDMIVTLATGSLVLRTNNGIASGNFSTIAAMFPISVSPQHAVFTDVNGDTNLDIVATSAPVAGQAGALTVMLGNGAGAFGNAANAPFGTLADPRGFALADVDGDGDLDVAVAHQGVTSTVQILLNATQPRLVCNGATDCGAPSYTRAISPQRNLNAAPNQTAMTWQFTEQITAATYTAIGSAQGPIRIFGMMTGQRNIASGGAWTYAMAATTATFNPARRFLNGEEVMVTMTSAQASLARVNVRPFVYSYRTRAGVGPAIFGNQEFSPYASGTNPQDVALGDVNGDGRVDMLAATGIGIVRRLNDGTGNFNANSTTIPTIGSPVAIALGDADNDGDLDIAVAGGGNVSVLLNNGMGAFTTMMGFPLAVGGNMVDIAWGDMNADGDLDLVLADRAASQIRLVNNNIDANAFSIGAATGIAGTPSALALSDFDNDGDLDVAAANNGGTSGLAIALNDGNGNLSLMLGTPIATPSTPEGIAAGDIDNDGDNDIALVTTTPDNALIYSNLMGGFTLSGTYAVGTSPSDVGLGDVDGDGDLDLVSINNGANTATIWKNDGTGVLNQTASGSPYGLGMQPLGVALADLDGDGDLDFVSANSASNTTSVMMNQGNAGLAFSLTNSGFINLFNTNTPVVVSRAQTPFTIGSFLGKTNLSNTSATLQYSIQAAAGGNAQFSIIGSSQGTINNASSISTVATFVWRNAPVRGGVTTAVIVVSPTFVGLLNATQITVTVIADPAFPLALAFSQSSSTGTQGVNFGAFNQGQLLSASGRPFNLAFGAWNGWNELAATNAIVRLRAFNTQGQEGNFTLSGTPTLLSGLANTATGVFTNLRVAWLNAPETAVSTQVTLRLVSESSAALSATNVTLTLLREPLEAQIISFSPSTGATGTVVTVRGTGLTSLTAAAIAGVPVQSFTVNSTNQVSLVVAAGTSGTIVLTNNFGSGESLGVFNFVQYPNLLGIQPLSACAGQVLTITGDNIADVQQVFVGNAPAASFRVNERGQVEAVVPQNADNGVVTLQNRAGTAVLNVMLVQTPAINGISPDILGTGGTLTVTGRNLNVVQAAQISPNTLHILSQSATTLTLRVSTQAQVISAPLRLESGSGCFVLSTQAISIAAPPTLTAVNITSLEVGQTLLLTGTNFVQGMTVSLGGVSAASVDVISPTEVRLSFSTNALVVAATGAALQATTPFGTATLQNTLIRLLPTTIIPANIDFTPDTGALGSTVTITGRGFVGITEVSFGGTPAQSFRVESPSRIVAIVGAGASGIVRVRSTTGTGESMRVFAYLTQQQLDSLAAVAFYRATNGATWTTSANWLVPQQALSRWFGLTVAQSGANAGRIIGINLSGNNVSTVPQNGAFSAISVTNAIVALSQMTALQTVNLSNNTLQGTLGSVVAGLRSVRSLNLANTGLSGRIPVELGTLDSLEIVKLDSNRLDGSLSDVFCTVFGQSMRNYGLRELRVASNRLTGDIPPCIVQFTRLQVLRLEDNQFTGRIPEGINRLANLREFVVARNGLSGELPRSLDSTTFVVFAGKQTSETNALTQLELFDVSSNQLSGTIPNGIAQSRSMKTLLLNNNQFSGRLPQTLPALATLETFNAAQNQLSGELWDNVGAMRSLRAFSVRNNRLGGIIPSSFVQIPSLERLELDNNSFVGNVPTELARMASLRVLGLSQNRLRTMPSLNALRQTLDSTRLERNMLTFESIETSVQVRNVTYSPQDSVGEASSRFVLVGSPINLNFSVGGAFNRYQWFRNGMAITDAQESPEFTLTRAALASNSGVYECRITNSLARDLTLFARALMIRVDTAEPTNEAVLANQVAAPRLVFPYPAGRNMPYALPLTWRAAIGAVVHEAQFSLLPDFSVLASNATISSTTLSVSGLRPGTRYYWRVRGIGAEGQRSQWSSDFFTTGVGDKPMQMTSIDFGRVSLADSVDGEALVVNFSNVAQTLQEIGLEDSNLSFTILDDVRQVIIPAEKYLTVRVRFAPRSTGVKLATTVLRYNESLRPERIDSVVNILQGTGVALKLSNVDFGIVRAGGTTLKSALLINTSPRPVTVQKARTRDSDRIFSVQGYLSNREFIIQALDTLLLLVRCSPPNAGRKFNGMLVLGDNDSVRAEIRAEARAFKEGDVVMRFGVRPKEQQDSVAPGGLVDVELFGKIDMGRTSDLIRAFDNLLQYRAQFNMDPNVLMLDTTERRAQQRRYIGVPNRVFVNIPAATFDITTLRNISETKREFVMTSMKSRSVSGSTATTMLEVEQAEWSASAPNLFVEAPINGTFTAKPCVAGGVRLTTTAKPNSVAIARPNPVKDVAEIHYALREDGNIAFAMVDMSGKQVTVLAEGYAEVGEYSMMLDVKAIPSGTYFLVLQTQSGVVRRRVEVVK
ncbi:MAG: T9SS C-terminal target domain-containing protein [Candidatus Kapaibacterium sp.]|nr:MAG: T9SS C-terminal target domain-containing protein [Candidatus Kapabacteria bacterium]